MDNVRSLDCGDDILLSICIPTYNRAEYLEKTLDSIVNQEGFTEHCEIVISDNCSPDNTAEVVNTFMEQYKNIRYYRNDTNVGELNFVRVMDLARGKYIKLNGDKIGFCETGLTRMIGYLEGIDVSVVFLLNNVNGLREQGAIYCKTFDEFVERVSFYSTWMSGIIFRKEDYIILEDKERASGSYLIQTDIMFNILNSKDEFKAVIINEKLIFEQPYDYRGGFNFFQVFITNYLGLYEGYLNNGVLSEEVFLNEKRSLLKKHIFSYFTKIVVFKQKNTTYTTQEATKIILSHYWKSWYLYSYPIFLCTAVIRKVKAKITRRKRNGIIYP